MFKKIVENKKDKNEKTNIKKHISFMTSIIKIVLIALVLRKYVISLYSIPSGSMETTLHGKTTGGDRVFATKFDYYIYQPNRWEVAIFKFPYEAAMNNAPDKDNLRYKNESFVKRIVGLPNETLAIAKGDIWTKNKDTKKYVRQVKPDSIQRGIWMPVYKENFEDIKSEELLEFWSKSGNGELQITKNETLKLMPNNERITLKYRPRVRAGINGEITSETPGITDRYVLRQVVQFKCKNIVNGKECGHISTKTVESQNIAARCPKCGSYMLEDSVIFYQRRSGLTMVGKFAVDPEKIAELEDGAQPRFIDYNFTPDLRINSKIKFEKQNSKVKFEITRDNRNIELMLQADGLAEIIIDNTNNPVNNFQYENAIDKWIDVEFYYVDGVIRVFINNSKNPIKEIEIPENRKPPVKELYQQTGVTITAENDNVEIKNINIDRDIYYFSGREYNRQIAKTQFNNNGEINLDKDSFLPLGDNTTSSYDARYWGPTPKELLEGKVRVVFWPPERIKIIKNE